MPPGRVAVLPLSGPATQSCQPASRLAPGLPNVSIDDVVFGVAAVGADGHESLVSEYVSPVRPSADVTVAQ